MAVIMQDAPALGRNRIWGMGAVISLASVALVAGGLHTLRQRAESRGAGTPNECAEYTGVSLVLSGRAIVDLVELRRSLGDQTSQAPLPFEVEGDRVVIPLRSVPLSSGAALIMEADAIAQALSPPRPQDSRGQPGLPQVIRELIEDYGPAVDDLAPIDMADGREPGWRPGGSPGQP